MSEASHPEQATPDDARLLAQLRDMFRVVDPPPPGVVELARQSFVLRNLDAELAALVEDSDQTTGGQRHRAMAVRGSGMAPEPRQLTFQFFDPRTNDELLIAIQVEAVGVRRRLTGHVAPQGPVEIEMRQPAVPEARQIEVDRLGRFVIEDVFPGPASITCRREGVPPVATQWTLI